MTVALLLMFNKPFGVLSQFTDSAGRETLADFIEEPGLYPAGRLDRDSEGLLLLTDDGQLAHRLTAPWRKTWKTYLAQVEGQPGPTAIDALCRGVELKDGITRPARVRLIEPPELWPRNPPIRFRAKIPTSWIELRLREGRNRQVRRMTAAVGHPTLRLVRVAVGPWQLDHLGPGERRLVSLPDATGCGHAGAAEGVPESGKQRPGRRRVGQRRRRR